MAVFLIARLDLDKQIVVVQNLNDGNEEEIIISKDGCELRCFAFPRPELAIGQQWEVELTLISLSDFKVTIVDAESGHQIERVGESYGCKITGGLNDGLLDACGYTFSCNLFEYEGFQWNGEIISIEVDRINVEFLSRVTVR